ncbi:hypothetical protein UFOVP855_41 [uncultured Caudovirales phage]|nr:hypothetical protein UFOVP527_18 [uncultured Caudovirales phage]CAB4167696.1 hypothetical protein UFOVP855_41 [uncultured Caudovirales phage]CAB4179080.1 hypothetical protein UFOVP1026_28 [uncultured Caudovirales phage]CAB4188325.1 hypothetical protein UFOVP1180_12 [uncultured Caudovirales phage]CAB4220510.1 hypothetical protein UFOVP1629_44 [uncultured Caudovirales phage]
MKTNKKCEIIWCVNSRRAKGYCSNHYRMIVTNGRPLEDVISRKSYLGTKVVIKCNEHECDNQHKAMGLCAKHYMRQRAHGDTAVNYKRGSKRTRKDINTGELRFTHSHEEVMILNDYFGEMVGYKHEDY